MSVATNLQLSQGTRDTLAELLTLDIDSRDGFRAAAEKMDDVTIGSLCQTLAMQRQAQADELARILEISAGPPDRSGSFAASVHRIWMDIREALSPDNTYALLAEAERGEDHIEGAYEEAARKLAATGVADVVNQHYGQVKAAHDRIRMLRDEYRE